MLTGDLGLVAWLAFMDSRSNRMHLLLSEMYNAQMKIVDSIMGGDFSWITNWEFEGGSP